MTEKQYELYKRKEREIEKIREFCEWCGNRYHGKVDVNLLFDIIARGKRLFLHIKWWARNEEDNIYTIPKELQEKIIAIIEDYLDEKEKEFTMRIGMESVKEIEKTIKDLKK